jgi:hypothetical protein
MARLGESRAFSLVMFSIAASSAILSLPKKLMVAKEFQEPMQES